METILLIPLLLGLFVAFFSLPFWIKRARKVGLVGRDMNKIRGDAAEGGGIAVILGFIIGILAYIGIKTFYFKVNDVLVQIFALLSVVLIISFVGIIDDILGWKMGLSKITRLLLLAIASFPLIVINAGESEIMGVNLGLIFPLILIPIGVVGASATFNFLAGYNGLEASQGGIILFALSVIAYLNGMNWLAIIAGVMICSLFAFYIFNKHPAKIFPGNILTYAVGALIAGIAILGNMEKIAVFFFIPYIIETGLKARGKLKKESYAKVNADTSLEMPYNKIYGLEHLAIYILKKIKKSKKVYEKEVVYLINAFQILIIIAGFLIFKNDIFRLWQ